MEQFIQRRLKDPRFAAADSSVKPWYQSTSYVREKHVFNEEMPKKKRKKRESDSGSDKSSSESEGEGEHKENEKKEETKKTGDGEKKGRCWEGYEPTPGKAPYTDGSCRKKKKKH